MVYLNLAQVAQNVSGSSVLEHRSTDLSVQVAVMKSDAMEMNEVSAKERLR